MQTNQDLFALTDLVNTFTHLSSTTTKYAITENFPKYGTREYNLFNLKMNTENEFISCTDLLGILSTKDNTYVLPLFLSDLVLDATREFSEETQTYTLTLTFFDGTITIKRII